jgi:putative copper export protein
MKKIIFYISIIISTILLVNIFQILTNDFERLTEYGFGYLIGKAILFVIFLTLILLTRKSVLNKKETE